MYRLYFMYCPCTAHVLLLVLLHVLPPQDMLDPNNLAGADAQSPVKSPVKKKKKKAPASAPPAPQPVAVAPPLEPTNLDDP